MGVVGGVNYACFDVLFGLFYGLSAHRVILYSFYLFRPLGRVYGGLNGFRSGSFVLASPGFRFCRFLGGS